MNETEIKKEIVKYINQPYSIEEIDEYFEDIPIDQIEKIINDLLQNELVRIVESHELIKYEKVDSDYKFIPTKVRKIAELAGYICTNPECSNLTIAPSKLLPGKSIKIGEAAHINGNKPTSARFDETLSENYIKSIENGIWLCRNCHKIVDSNKGKDCTIELLKKWKTKHNEYLSKNLGKPVYLSTDNLKMAQTFKSWSKNNAINFPKIFIRSPDRDLIMEKLKKKINLNNQTNQIIRLSGLSGLGKTRLIYETLKSGNFRKNIYYYDNVSHFFKSEIYTMLKNNNSINLILVIDNCTLDNHQKIKNNFSLKTNKILIITIGFHNEIHDNDNNYFQLEFMNPALIEEILELNFNEIPKKRKKKILDVSHCFPKFALKFVLKNNHQNMKYIASDDDINRLIFGEKTSLNKERVKKVLTHIALFSRLGYFGKIKDEYFKTSEQIDYPLGNLNNEEYNLDLKLESKWICQLLDLNWADYTKIITEFKKKGIIRGESRLNIGSIPLVIFLVNDYWSQNSDVITTIESIPQELIYYLIDQFFTVMELYCVFKEDSESYKYIIEFLKNLEEKELYLEEMLDFIIFRYEDLNVFDREMLLQKVIKREELACIFLKSILIKRFNNLRPEDKIEWIKKIINIISVEKISQILNEWSVYIFGSKCKKLVIDIFQKLIEDIEWNNSITKSLFIYFDFLSDQTRYQFRNQLEKNAEYISILIVSTINRLSEETLIQICENLFNLRENNTHLLNILAYFQNSSLIKYNKYLLLELSKNEECVNSLFIFILRNQELFDEKILEELIKKTNKFTSLAGKAFQNLLFEILNYKKEYFKNVIPLIKTYKNSKEIVEAKNSLYELSKNMFQIVSLISQYNLPDYKMLSERNKPCEIQYLIISLNISKQVENKFYDFYNIFLYNEFFYYINSIIFPNSKFYKTPKQRDLILKNFISLGFYLVDFYHFGPKLDFTQENIKFLYENMFKFKLETLISKKTPIIIIDENLYQGLYKNLKKDGFIVIHEQPIPKPNEKNYDRFKELFKEALTIAGYKPR